MSSRGGHSAALGGNLMIASALAMLSYVPFEWVAKGTLLLSAFLFVFDPFPPLSRIVAMVSLIVVSFLSRAFKNHIASLEEIEMEEDFDSHPITNELETSPGRRDKTKES